MTRPPPTADAQTLLSHVEWVRALARGLVSESRAEDLSQEALLRAMRAPRPPDRWRSWFTRVCENLAREEGRKGRARTNRERRTSRRNEVDATADVVARAELHRIVVEELLSMEEPYRSTLLRCFFDGLEPPALAARLGLGVDTIYSRLRRGLERLRGRLARRGVTPSRMLLLGIPGAALRRPAATQTEVGRPESAPANSSDSTHTGATPYSGAKAMLSTKMGAVLLAVITVVVGFGLRLPAMPSRAGSSVDTTPTPTAAQAPGPGALPLLHAIRQEISPRPDRGRDSLALANDTVFVGRCTLLGRIVDGSGVGVSDAEVALHLAGAELAAPGMLHVPREELRAYGFVDTPLRPPRLGTTTEEDGRFRLPGARSGLAYHLEVRRSGERAVHRFRVPLAPTFPLDAAAGADAIAVGSAETIQLPDLVLPATEPLRVLVLGDDAEPVAGAIVSCDRLGAGSSVNVLPRDRVGVSDENGRLEFHPRRDGRLWIVARAIDGREGAAVRDWVADEASAGERTGREGPSSIDARAGRPTRTSEEVVVRLRDGSSLDLRLVSSKGRALPGLRVNVWSHCEDLDRRLIRTCITDYDGRATFRGLPPTARRLHVDCSGGMPSVTDRSSGLRQVELEPEVEEHELVVDLLSPPIELRFRDARDASAVRSSSVQVVEAAFRQLKHAGGIGFTPTRGEGVLVDDGRGALLYIAQPGSEFHDDGTKDFTRRQAVEFGVVVDAPGFGPQRFGPYDPDWLIEGIPLVLDLVPGHHLRGHVVDEDGVPVVAARVRALGVGEGRAASSTTFQLASVIRAARTDADGAFELGPLPAGPRTIELHAAGFLSRSFELELPDRDLEAAPWVLRRGTVLEGKAHFGKDVSRGDVLVAVQTGASPRSVVQTCGLDQQGRYRFELEPGEVRLLALTLDALGGDGSLRRDSARIFGSELTKALEDPAGPSILIDLPAEGLDVQLSVLTRADR